MIIDLQIDRLSATFDIISMQDVVADRSGANHLQLGVTTGDTPVVARYFAYWDFGALCGKVATKATAYFYNLYSKTCAARPWDIWTTNPASAQIRWSNQLGWPHQEQHRHRRSCAALLWHLL